MSTGDDVGATSNERKPRAVKLPSSVDDYLNGIKAGDRTILAKAITLVESTRAADRSLAGQLLDACVPLSGGSVRLGVSGLPGAGKSTLLDRLGVVLVGMERRVAVLTIDPSSGRTGGSILGDKTRMGALAREAKAFIRPSPTGGVLGGVAAGTREAIILCEAAGHDVVIVETVGVGQSESVVADLVDFVLLLLVPGTGDELQGIKRGVIEYAHAIAITKADGANMSAANEMFAMYRELMRHVQPTEDGWQPQVMITSAVENRGIEELWSVVTDYQSEMKRSGGWDRRRSDQAVHWMHAAIDDALRSVLVSRPGVRVRIEQFESEVRSGKISPRSAAAAIVRDIAGPTVG